MLADLLRARTVPLRVTYGEVTDNSPLTVRINGTAAADAVLIPLKNEDYTPTTGDEVLILQVGGAAIVWGSYA